jgi:hypothetical protein
MNILRAIGTNFTNYGIQIKSKKVIQKGKITHTKRKEAQPA